MTRSPDGGFYQRFIDATNVIGAKGILLSLEPPVWIEQMYNLAGVNAGQLREKLNTRCLNLTRTLSAPYLLHLEYVRGVYKRLDRQSQSSTPTSAPHAAAGSL